jgi:uncharacterized protein (UPF0147 family)
VLAREIALKQAWPPNDTSRSSEGVHMTIEIEKRIEQIATVIEQLDDPKVPRNIRKGAKDTIEKWLKNKSKQMDVRIAITQAKLEELYEDPNIPMEFGTLILQINTALEQMLGDLHS